MYKLLIVDDNRVQLNYLTDCIDYSKINITEIKTAADGLEGIEIYNEFKPDIIITDVEMPVVDGVEMMRKLISDGCCSKFIFISCYDDFEYIKEAMDHNAASYILKPVDTKELENSIIKATELIEKENSFTELNRILGESLENFRENFLYRFLHSTHIDENCLKNTLNNLGFNKYNEFLAAVCDTGGSIDIYCFLNIVKNRKSVTENEVAVVESDNRLTVVFMNENDKLFYENIKRQLEEFCDSIEKEHKIKLRIGLSNVGKTLYDAKLLMSRAAGALDEKIFSYDSGVCEYDSDVQNYEPEYEIAELFDSVMYMLKSKEKDPVNEFLLKYYTASQNIEYIKKLSISVVTTLQLILMERGININELYGSSAVIWDKIDRFETIPDTRRWLYNILNTALEFINDNECGRYKKIVNDIMENINKNYASVSNVNEIIGDLYISASYAQSIFKKHTGKTISDYVLDKRMEAAKKMLADPYIKVYEVAERVGYKSKAHFTEIFKKYTGLTPKEFRAIH